MRLTSVGHIVLFLTLWCLQVIAIVDRTDIAEPAQELSVTMLDGPHPILADTDAEHPLVPTTTTDAELLAKGLKPNPPLRLFDPTRIRRQVRASPSTALGRK